MKKHNLIYKITNTVNNKIYIGCHQTDDLNDGYLGSGKILKRSIEKYGIEKFFKEILYDFETPEEMFIMECKIVDAEFVKRKDTYNLKIGGEGGWDHTKGKIFVKDNQNKYCWVEKDDPRYLSGELKHFTKNKVVVKEETGKTFQVFKNDPRYLSGELKPIWSGKKHSEETKRKIGEKNSKNHGGEKNSQFNTCWIFKEDEKKNKKIKKEELREWLNLGWKIGRKMKF